MLGAFDRSSLCRELAGDLGGSAVDGVISGNGRWLAVGGGARLGIWDLQSEGPAEILTQVNVITPFFSPDNSELFAFWNDGFLRWRIVPGVERDTPPRLEPLPVHKPDRIYSGAFVGERLVLGTADGVRVVPASAIEASPSADPYFIGAAYAKNSPNGMWLACRKRDPHREEIYLLEPWNELRRAQCDSAILAEAFTPGSDELAVATYTSVSFLDTNRWDVQRRFPIALDPNARIIFTPDGAAFWLVHNARSAALHDTRTFETLLPFPTGSAPLAVSPNGRFLVLGVDARRVQIWDLPEVRKVFRELGLDWKQEQSSPAKADDSVEVVD